MPIADCCGKDIKYCTCNTRSRSRERREREAKEEKAKAEQEPVRDLTDLLHRIDCRAEKRELQTKEEIVKLIEDNDEKWKIRMEEDRREILRIQEEATDKKITQSEAKTSAELEKIWKEISEFKKGDIDFKGAVDSSTILFGGLQNLSFDDAQEWIKEQIKERKLEEPEIMYYKGDEYVGLVFAKFAVSKAADEVVRKMSKLKRGQEEVWCKKDLPLDRRVPLSFLLGTRRQLISWGFTKSNVRVQEESNTLTVAGQPVMKAFVSGSTLKLDWINQEWKNWTEFVESTEFNELTKKAEGSVQKAEDAKGKGKGKDRA